MQGLWTFLTVFVVLVGAASQSVFSADNPKKDPPKIPSALEKRFKMLDKDKDGKLTLAEYTADAKDKPVMKERLTARFKRLDTDNDGKLTLEEFTKPLKNDDD